VPDIDLDFFNREDILNIVKHVPASMIDNGTVKKHKTGVYCTEIPYNPLTGTASIDYKTAEQRGYFKLDFLNVGMYAGVRNEEHLVELMNKEPLWELLIQDEFVELLFHLNGHGDILRKTLPTSVEQLAAVLAMIRPAKRYLVGKDWKTIMSEVWIRPTTNEYFFKKSHAHSYAVAIIVHMNLLCDKIEKGELKI
jgi:hypothetical protein